MKNTQKLVILAAFFSSLCLSLPGCFTEGIQTPPAHMKISNSPYWLSLGVGSAVLAVMVFVMIKIWRIPRVLTIPTESVSISAASRWLTRILGILLLLPLANYVLFSVISETIGGVADPRATSQGHYYLIEHDRIHERYSEVSEAVFEYSLGHKAVTDWLLAVWRWYIAFLAAAAVLCRALIRFFGLWR